MSTMSTNITRDPPQNDSPTVFEPTIVYASPTTQGSLAGVQIIGFKNTASGTVPASLFNAAQVTAANYIRDHVKQNFDQSDPKEKELADKMIEALFNDIATAAENPTKTFTDALGNKYTGADLVKLIKNVDFKIYDPISAAAANVANVPGGATTFDSFGDITSHATVTFELGSLLTKLGNDTSINSASYAVAHELGHALPAGHQIALQDWNAVRAANPGVEGAALLAAWENSFERADSEAFANTFGHEITTFLGASWLPAGTTPGYGYWHGIM